MIDRNYQKKKF